MDDPCISGRWERRPRAQGLVALTASSTPRTSGSSPYLLGTYCVGYATLFQVPSEYEREQGKAHRIQRQEMRRPLTEAECPQGGRHRSKGTLHGRGLQGGQREEHGTLTDDSCKETKLQGPARRQGPPEAGRTDARQVRRLAKRGTCGTPGGSSQTPGLSLSNQNKQ